MISMRLALAGRSANVHEAGGIGDPFSINPALIPGWMQPSTQRWGSKRRGPKKMAERKHM